MNDIEAAGQASSTALDELARIFGAELDARACSIDAFVQWPDGLVRQRYFLDDSSYPPELLGSARAVVFRGPRVVVVRDRTGARHVQPGGHVERGETPEEAVRRELLEETGWRVGELRYFGFSFVESAGPSRLDARRWRGHVHVFFIAEAASYHRSARDVTQIEVGSSLVSFRRAQQELSGHQPILLKAAIQRRRPAPVQQHTPERSARGA